MTQQRAKVWRVVSTMLLRHGYVEVDALNTWASHSNWPLTLLQDVARGLCLESFQRGGKECLRLSGKVVPIMPREIYGAETYRSLGGGNAA